MAVLEALALIAMAGTRARGGSSAQARSGDRRISGQIKYPRPVGKNSIVECREQLKLIGLTFVMIDEQRRLVRCDQLPDSFH
jgi:hypothetical protein